MHYHRCPGCYEDEPCRRYCYIEPSLSDPGALTEDEEEINASGAVVWCAHNEDDPELRLRGAHAYCETCRPKYDAMRRLGGET